MFGPRLKTGPLDRIAAELFAAADRQPGVEHVRNLTGGATVRLWLSKRTQGLYGIEFLSKTRYLDTKEISIFKKYFGIPKNQAPASYKEGDKADTYKSVLYGLEPNKPETVTNSANQQELF